MATDMDMDQDNSSINSLDTSRTQLSQKDPGLFLLVPLYKLLRFSCTQTIFKIIVTEFKNCKYVRENPDAKPEDKNLCDFFKTINCKGTNRQKKVKEQEKKKNNQEKDKQKNNQEKNKLSWQIYNIDDNEEILKLVNLYNLLDADEEQCKPLKNLDLNFLLNILTNAILLYPLSDAAHKSIVQIKEIRNELYHAKYNFGMEEFNKNLIKLQEALQEIYNGFGIPLHDLDMQIKECRREANGEDLTSEYKLIFGDLQREIHDKYKATQNFVCPTIREESDGEEKCHESLEIYLRDHYNKPILLCGKRGSGKLSILQNQAFQLVRKLNNAQNLQYQGDKPQFSLIILFEEKPNVSLKKENFWENVTKIMKNLAPKAAARHGIDALMVAVKCYIEEIVFLVNWSLQDITAQFKETSNGTWVFTYNGYPGKSADWDILITEPLKEPQVNQMLKSLNPNPRDCEIILEKYSICNYKDVLTTPDMVNIFNELSNEPGGLGTEYELMLKYVEKKIKEGNLSDTIIKAVGKLAFHGIKRNKTQFRIGEVEKDIDELGQLAFFTKNRNYFELIHNTLMDFLASIYVIENPNEACKEWLNNTTLFKRAFKFACSFWFLDVDHFWKKSVQTNGTYKDYYKEKMEDFLCKFLSVTNHRTEKRKDHKSSEMQQSCTQMEVDDQNADNNTNVNMDTKNNMDSEILKSGHPVKNPFDKWGFLVHIDEACDGLPEILNMLANLLSNIKCWVFKCKHLDDSKMTRVHKILKKVKLSPSSPVFIKIESGPGCNMLINIWNKLKNTESLYNSVKVKIAIMHEKKEGNFQILDDGPLKGLPRAIVNARAPIYITELSMPLFSPKIPDFKFSMCACIQKLETLDTIVYDVISLREVLVCANLPNMKSIKIYVDLKVGEQGINNPPQLKLPNPNKLNVNLTIVYFKEVQKLLDAFTSPHNLLSLSIRNLIVDEGFKLDFSKFRNMEGLYLHCNTPFNVQLKSSCALLLALNLTLPNHLERLMLSKVYFYNDNNIHLFRNFFAKYNIQRLMILDSNLSLDGARTVLKQHVFQEKETDLDIDKDLDLEMNKKMKLNGSDSSQLKGPVSKKPRLTKEVRLNMQKNKPKGKEIIITSNTELKSSTICNLKPCQCEIQCTTNTLQDLSALIGDTYCYDILNFAFNNKNVIVRKDLCNDLRVHCPLFKIEDDYIYQIQQNEIPVNSPIIQLFQSLTLTQSLYIENTALSYDGIMSLVTILKRYKSNLCQDNLVEPFSLTVTSNYHPCDDVHGMKSEVLNSQIIEFLKQESCLQMFNLWCTCFDRCHRLKKTHDGDIYFNDEKLKK